MPQLKFLVDACVDVRLARWLRDQGHDARHLRDEGLHKLPDETIFAKAIAEGCVVITHDLDFGEIAALTRGTRPALSFSDSTTRALLGSRNGCRQFCQTASPPCRTARS